jgi:LemA protein
MYRRILVPLDGTPFGDHALPYAVDIAVRTGAALELVHVHHHREHDPTWPAMPQYQYQKIGDADHGTISDERLAERRAGAEGGMGMIVILVIIVAIALFVMSMYNRLVSLRNRFKNAFAQIDVQLKRRYDLIPNLVETAKAYMKHERETLEAVIAARNAAAQAEKQVAGDPTDVAAMQGLIGAERSLAGAMTRFFALAEAYPDLKADANMRQLSEELTSTENRVAFARQALQRRGDAVQHGAGDVSREPDRRQLRLRGGAAAAHRGRRGARGAARLVLSRRAARHAMDFFEAQDSARTRTRTLVVLFVAAVRRSSRDLRRRPRRAGPGPAGGIDPLLLLAVADGDDGCWSRRQHGAHAAAAAGRRPVAELLGGRASARTRRTRRSAG